MKVTLSQQCLSLTGMLKPELGYYLQKRKDNFYAARKRGFVPPDGHWRFIVLCAEMAHNKLYITDIKVDWLELMAALGEAGHFVAERQVASNFLFHDKDTYDARDILNFKTTFSL